MQVVGIGEGLVHYFGAPALRPGAALGQQSLCGPHTSRCRPARRTNPFIAAPTLPVSAAPLSDSDAVPARASGPVPSTWDVVLGAGRSGRWSPVDKGDGGGVFDWESTCGVHSLGFVRQPQRRHGKGGFGGSDKAGGARADGQGFETGPPPMGSKGLLVESALFRGCRATLAFAYAARVAIELRIGTVRARRTQLFGTRPPSCGCLHALIYA